MRNLVIVSFLFLQLIVFSQQKQYRFDQINTSQRLLSNNTSCVLQDYFGFIWIGSSQGLSCYNGTSIKTYKQNNKDSLSISSNVINCLFEDSRNRMWIGTSYGGLNLYNRELDIFEHISFKDTNNFNPDNDIVNAIAESPDGNIFVGTKNGMLIYNPLTKTYTRYNHSNSNPFSIVGDNISVLMMDSKNRLWIGTTEYSGLGMYDLKLKTFKTYVDQETERDTVGLKGLNTICEDYLGRIWVGSRERGLSVFNPGTSQFVDITSFNTNLKSNLLSRIWHITKDCKDNLWIGSANNGLFIYNLKENILNNILPEETNKNGLSSPAITYCMEDDGHNMWFCTLGGGVNILRKIKNNFEFHTHTQNENSLSNSFVSSFYEDAKGNIWIGTDGGALNKFDPINKKFIRIKQSKNFNCNSITDIEKASGNNLWISTLDNGLHLFNTETFQSQTFYDVQSSNSLSHNQVKDIELIGEKLYIATYGDGINIYDTYKNQFINHLNNRQLSDILYAPLFGNQIYRDAKNRIWVASIRGLYLIDDNKVKTFVYSPFDTTSINSNHVVTIYQDKKKQIWIGTKKGLNLYNETTGKFLNMNLMSRLPEDIKAILEDKKGNLWISSNIGITKFNPVSLETIQFTEADGLQANEFYERSCLLAKNGKMYFGGINGFSAFYPEDIEVTNTESVPYLTELRVLNQVIKPNDKTGILEKNILFSEEITIPHNKSTFSIEFSSIDDSHAQRLKYAYKMENLDQSWTYVEDNNKAYFTNLDPGIYFFKVKAASGSLRNSNQMRILKIIITPPIWAQFWFKVLAFVIITLVVFYYVQRKIWRLEKMKKELAKEVKERTFEIELQKDQLEDLADKLQLQNLSLREHQEQLQETFSELKIQSDELKIANSELKKINETKNKLFSLIAHDLKGPIGSIKSFSSLLVSDFKDLEQKEIIDYLEIIQDSSHASVEMFENLLEWARSQTESVQFKPEAVNLKDIVSNVIDFQSLTASNKNIQIVNRVNKNIWFYADKNMLLTIYRNLISNSIKFTNEGGAITIQSEETDKEILISVKDTGIGMTDKRINSLLNKEDQYSSPGTEGEKGMGLGLTICKEFLHIHGGKMLVESELGVGTTIIVVLPNKKVESKDFVSFPDAVDDNDVDLEQNASILKDKLLLIIDDNANSRHAIKHSLKNKCEIIEAKNGLQGIELAKEKMPDCIISDIIMPEKTGIELCRELKADKFTNFIPIILLTSSKEEMHKRDAYSVGADEFITKPFNPEMLESRIINLLIKQENIKKVIRESISLEEENLNSTINNEFLQKVHDIANQHINDSEFSIEFLASQLGYSRYQFFRKFKAIVGQTPVEYILNYRLQKAEILLRKGKLRVSEIAYETGFSNPKYFATTFRKKYGMTPSEYMEKRQMAGLS